MANRTAIANTVDIYTQHPNNTICNLRGASRNPSVTAELSYIKNSVSRPEKAEMLLIRGNDH